MVHKYSNIPQWKSDFHLWGFTIAHKSIMLSLNIKGSSSWTIAKITYQGHKDFPLEQMHMSNSFDFIEVIHKVDQTSEQNHWFD